MNRFLQILVLAALITAFQIAVFTQEKDAIAKTQNFINEVIKKSYPELKAEKINVKTFKSDSNYFKSQFSVSRFLTFQKLYYTIFINPEIYKKNAPETAIRAILAHEFAHILYYKRKDRLELFGLVALSDNSFTAKFERKADLEAIARGYGEGLKEYRQWLYQYIPEKNLKAKKRNYFSPDEIELILQILEIKPEMIDIWRENVPRNLSEISSLKS